MQHRWLKISIPLIVLIVGMGGMSAIKATAKDDEEKNPVDTRPSISFQLLEPISHEVTINGTGEISPKESTLLSAQVSGEVDSIHPNFVSGGIVKRGDVLFTIERDNYEAALLQAQAEVSRAEATLIEEEARAEVAKREAKNLPAVRVTDLYLRKPQVLSAKAGLQSAQSRLKIAQKDLNDTTIRAPYDALITQRNVGVGQFVNRGVEIARIHNIETAELVFPIAGFDSVFLPQNIIGNSATVSARGVNQIIRQGTITRDLGMIDSATRMTQLVVEINDPYALSSQSPKLKFGHFVDVEFAGKTITSVFKIPQSLVTNRRVWIVDSENKLRPRDVHVLREEGKYFFIDKGLQTGDKLVVTLPEYPLDGMEVKIIDNSNNVAATPAS